MLKRIKRSTTRQAPGRFAIVASLYNRRYVDALLRGARSVLRRAGSEAPRVVRVPGAFEIPVVAARLAGAEKPPDAIICLGVILRGQTAHAQLVAEAVTGALMEIQVAQGIPVVHEVLLLENEDQAAVRCLDPRHHRGAEAAQTALVMARVMRLLACGWRG